MEEATEKIKRFFEKEQAEFRDLIEAAEKAAGESPGFVSKNYSELLSWIVGHSGKLYDLLEELAKSRK